MRTINCAYRNSYLILLILLSTCICSCEDFVSVDSPLELISKDEVFENEATATAAITSLYSILRDDTLLTGKQLGLNVLMGFYADELVYYGPPAHSVDAFYQHQILAEDAVVKITWDNSYSLIYMSNAAIEGIDGAQRLSYELKQQLKGEALFVRAITHFYLMNLFGDIPYVTSTDYITNSSVSRTETSVLYNILLNDLLTAKDLLSDEYIGGERIRANKFVASALMARLYLYKQDWQNAVNESSAIINASSIFEMETIENEFLRESRSAILQLKPKNEGETTHEASTFIFTSGPPAFIALSTSIVDLFNVNDLRRQQWILEVTDGLDTWYAPYKYRYQESTGGSLEYSMVLRLAEQYLIRAEAHAHLGELDAALADLNRVRNRAGLPNSTAVSMDELLQAIAKERAFELFTEQGHRWFDLKRTGQAEEVIAPIKPNWRSSDILLPIPEIELSLNPNLAPQNPGY